MRPIIPVADTESSSPASPQSQAASSAITDGNDDNATVDYADTIDCENEEHDDDPNFLWTAEVVKTRCREAEVECMTEVYLTNRSPDMGMASHSFERTIRHNELRSVDTSVMELQVDAELV